MPILVLSYFAYTSVSELLNKNANRQIYSESRAVGLTLFDRFLNIESNLLFTSRYINEKQELEKYIWLNKIFESIFLVEKGVVHDVVFGKEAFDIHLTKKQKKHLKRKGLLLVNKENQQFKPLMVLSIDNDKEKYIVGNINRDYLWSIFLNGQDIFCVVIDRNKLVFCSDGKTEIAEAYFDESGEMIDIKEKTKSEPYNVFINNNEYVSNIWDLFLQPQYGAESFLILYFVRKNEAFLDYNFYKSVFPQTIFITLLLVYLLSSVQMRRSLIPLSKLTQAVKNITAGDYSKKVEIESDNEFKSLASAFNKMSTQINSQFIKLNTLSKIDRLILSASDADYVVEVLLQYMPKILPGDNFSLLVFNDEHGKVGLLYYFNDSSNDLIKSNMVLEAKEFAELDNASEILVKKLDGKDSYANLVNMQGSAYMLAYPVHDTEKMLAVILIGFKGEPDEANEYHNDIKEVADRAAVAISNAQWEQKLFHQAHFDALTALPNRYLFKDRLEQAIERAKRNELNVAVLFIDLDRFKSINDSLGHVVGDKVLVEVSDILLKCVRTYDSVSRFGGDEYTIVMTDIPTDEVELQTEHLANRVLTMMSDPIIIENREFYISPSIGISIYPKDANNFDDLLKNADSAMYKAKKMSSGNYQYYQPLQNSEVLGKMQMEVDLRHALKEEQFELVFQPKLDLLSDKIIGVEALLRWKHPEKGIISPNTFIPIAEECGLIKSIGYWVLKEACKLNKQWQENSVFITTAVNISTEQFRHPGFFKKINEILNETKTSARNIELEITESITIDDFVKTRELLDKLRELGFIICIDDFGTGYSSMTYLQQIPVNKLKIDKYFIDGIERNHDAASIVGAINALAHNMNLKVVAEGVEKKAQLQYLIDIYCDEIQGFYLSKPLSSEKVIQFIETYNKKSG